MSTDVDDFLAHYGVKGMKWGTRKGYKAAVSNIARISDEVNKRQHEARLNSSLTETAYNKLDNKDIVVKKGSVVKRTSKDPNSDSSYRDLFVSTNETDAKRYRGLLPMGESQGLPSKKHEGYFETTFKAVNDLRSPSEKTRVDAYIRLMDVPEIYLDSGEKVTGKEYMRRQGLGDVVDKLSSKQLALTYYGQLAVTQGIRDDPINSAYFNSMRSKGYNALVDDNDRAVISDTPLLVFDAYKNLETLHVKQLTTADVQEAQATMTIPERKSNV